MSRVVTTDLAQSIHETTRMKWEINDDTRVNFFFVFYNNAT